MDWIRNLQENEDFIREYCKKINMKYKVNE